MKINSGKYKNKNIATKLKGVKTEYRPTSIKTRQAVFNILMHTDLLKKDLDQCVVADICSGSGSFGLEALSRGAMKCIFVDIDNNQLKLTKHNIQLLGEVERTECICSDAVKLRDMGLMCDLVYIDPPYRRNIYSDILERLRASNWLAEGALIAIECDRRQEITLPEGFTLLDERIYGRVRVLFVR